MSITRLADAVLRRVVPSVEAGAATNCYCAVRYSRCLSGYWVDYLYWKVTDYYGRCTIWGAFCSSRRTGERC
jgi:hypothetical protein